MTVLKGDKLGLESTSLLLMLIIIRVCLQKFPIKCSNLQKFSTHRILIKRVMSSAFKKLFFFCLRLVLKINFLIPDLEYPGTQEKSTVYFLAVFIQNSLLLSDTWYPGFLLKLNITGVVCIRKSSLYFVSSILTRTQNLANGFSVTSTILRLRNE